MIQASVLTGFLPEHEWQTHLTRGLGRAFVLSLVLHVGIMAVAAWVRLPKHAERPLASIEISLATLPAPTTPDKVVEPKKTRPKDASAPEPVRRVKSAPLPIPSPPPPAPVKTPPMPVPSIPPIPVMKPSNDVMRDAMKGIELPPEAPRFGDFSPAEKPRAPQLQLPEVPVISQTQDSSTKFQKILPRPSLAEDVSKELDEEFKKIGNIELPKPTPSELSSPKPVPQIEARAPSVKEVNSTLKIAGMAAGSNAYFGRVRQRISSFWTAPPVDVTGQTYVVIVRFRLHRNGSVTEVGIEESSGNEYYDLAGKRAVLSAIPLPAFPPEFTETYFDAHFTFRVGESQG